MRLWGEGGGQTRRVFGAALGPNPRENCCDTCWGGRGAQLPIARKNKKAKAMKKGEQNRGKSEAKDKQKRSKGEAEAN